MRERVWVDKAGCLRWRRSKYAYVEVVHGRFFWAKMVRDGLAVAVATDGIYRVQWWAGSMDDTLTLTKIERL